MSRIIARGRAKLYVRIPKGEIQIGFATRSVVVWFRRRKYTLKRANWRATVRWLDRHGGALVFDQDQRKLP